MFPTGVGVIATALVSLHSEQKAHPCRIANSSGRSKEGQSDDIAHSAPYEKTAFPNVGLPCMDRQGVFK
jgi:hypothetical protein